MKKILKISLCAVMTITFAGICATASGKGRNELKGSGKMITRTMEAPEFNGIHASRDVQVVLSATADKITVTADDNLMQYVKVDVEQGTLVATMDLREKRLYSISNIHITVTVPARSNLQLLKASSDANILGETQLKSDKIRLEASSDGKITLRGAAGQCSVDVSSDGRLEAAGFAIKDGDIEASSDGRATVQVSGMLRARASSDAVIHNTIQSASSDITKSSDGKVLQF